MISCMSENMNLMLLDISSNTYKEVRTTMIILRKSPIWQAEISIHILRWNSSICFDNDKRLLRRKNISSRISLHKFPGRALSPLSRNSRDSERYAKRGAQLNAEKIENRDRTWMDRVHLIIIIIMMICNLQWEPKEALMWMASSKLRNCSPTTKVRPQTKEPRPWAPLFHEE